MENNGGGRRDRRGSVPVGAGSSKIVGGDYFVTVDGDEGEGVVQMFFLRFGAVGGVVDEGVDVGRNQASNRLSQHQFW